MMELGRKKMKRNLDETRFLTCVGMGLIALDVIYDKSAKRPKFLAGGSCGNVLTILSYLGWKSYPVARLGNDHEGSRILEDMFKWGVNTRFVERDSDINSPRIIERIIPGKKSRHKFYIKCDHGKWLPRRRLVLPKSLDDIIEDIPLTNVFYFDRASPSALILAHTLKLKGALIVFEPSKFLHNNVFLDCLKVAHVVKHCSDQAKETKESGVEIPLEIQTEGKLGLRFKLMNGDWKYMEAFSVPNLVDAAGSGDWLTAGIISELVQKGTWRFSERKLKYALDYGQALASINCNFVGARGTMYNLSRRTLTSLVNKILIEKELSDFKNIPSMKTKLTSPLTSKCKVCLCNN